MLIAPLFPSKLHGPAFSEFLCYKVDMLNIPFLTNTTECNPCIAIDE